MSIRNLNFILFGDYKKLEAQPELILKIASKLLENGVAMNPGTFQQMNPSQGVMVFERIMFNNPKEMINVRINVDSIEINTTISDNKEYNFKSHMDTFISKVKKIIKSLIESIEDFNLGVRVSYITEIIYDDKGKIKPLEDIYLDLNNRIPEYSKEETFEWNTRAVKRVEQTINNSSEILNLVTEVLKVDVEVNNLGIVSEYDTISTKIDINTVYFNNNPRINVEFVNEFLELASSLFSSHNKPLEVKIFGE